MTNYDTMFALLMVMYGIGLAGWVAYAIGYPLYRKSIGKAPLATFNYSQFLAKWMMILAGINIIMTALLRN